jgi:sodium-dependent dicarboxylate transporter 2/3/5
MKNIPLISGPLIFAIFISINPFNGLNATDMAVLGLLLWMVIWWVKQVIAIHITALLPIAIIPVFTEISAKVLSGGYAHPIVFLILGGSLFAVAFEKTRLNQRIALAIINRLGFSKRKIILSVSLSVAFMSMWISNSSATITMLPVVLMILHHINNNSDNYDVLYERCLLLVLAHSASIGGISTLIGTPPNAVLASQAKILGNIEIGFLEWLAVGLPLSIIGLMIMYFMMTRVIFKIKDEPTNSKARLAIQTEYQKLGKISTDEWTVIALFSSVVFFWLFKSSDFLQSILPMSGKLTDTGVIMIAAILLFVIRDSQKQAILSWEDVANKIPWAVLMLIGGGIALAIALKKTSVVPWLVSSLDVIGIFPVLLVLILLALMVTFITEINSNTATTIILVPVVWALALKVGFDPLLLAVTVAVTASSAFMLPTATVPNAIICNSKAISVADMTRSGILLNLTIAPTFAIMVYFILVQWGISF